MEATSCCSNPPCSCAKGTATISLDGALGVQISDKGPGNDDYLADISGSVGTGVSLHGKIDCDQYCLSGCFDGVVVEATASFFSGFIGSSFTHYLACPHTVGGGCYGHNLSSAIPGAVGNGCSGATDVCGNPLPDSPSDDSESDDSESDTPTFEPYDCSAGIEECQDSCTPNCGSNACGPDGCGGSCGDCPEPFVCSEGQCEAPL